MSKLQVSVARYLGIYFLFFSCFLQAVPTPPSQDLSELGRVSQGKDNLMTGSVFIYGDQTLDNLIPVRVIGAVGKAGLHYVPKDLDLLTLLTLAGGATTTADVQHITIKRGAGSKATILAVNLESVVTETDAVNPIMQAADTVYIPQEPMLISENISRTVTLLVGIVSIAASIFVISRR